MSIRRMRWPAPPADYGGRGQGSALLPGIGLDVSPVKPLQRYQQASSLLTILLYAFSVPILALILDLYRPGGCLFRPVAESNLAV